MNDFALSVLTAPQGNTWLFSVGQAGFILKSRNGQLLGIDLYLSDAVERIEGGPGFKRLLPKLLALSELRFDVLIATHPHLDHFDPDAIPLLMAYGDTRLFASVNCEAEVRRLHMSEERVSYVRPGDIAECGDFRIDFVNCDHGTSAPDAVGVVVTVDGKKIYEAGDTCLRLDRVDQYREKGPFDVMIAPINGAFGNMNEEECARFSDALKPALTIPCHYGMFAAHGGDPGRFCEIMAHKYPRNPFSLMCMGERIKL